MKRWARHLPSPALLVACAALFVALGGTVLAATKINGHTIRVKSLPGNRLAVGSVPGNRLRPGTIPGDRLAPRSVNGAQIDVDTLGQVPSATHAEAADTARRAQTATAADHASDATTVNGHRVGCTAGRREFAGACWDLQSSTAAVTAIEAAARCGAEGGELPDALALVAFAKQPGVTLTVDGEWTKQISNFGVVDQYSVVFVYPDGRVSSQSSTERLRFRCVTSFLHS